MVTVMDGKYWWRAEAHPFLRARNPSLCTEEPKPLMLVIPTDHQLLSLAQSFFGDDPPLPQAVGWVLCLGFGFGFCAITLGLVKLDESFSGTKITSEFFNTAGRDVKVGLTAAVIVSQWTWAATLLQSSNVAWRTASRARSGASVVACPQLGRARARALRAARARARARAPAPLALPRGDRRPSARLAGTRAARRFRSSSSASSRSRLSAVRPTRTRSASS